MHPKCAHCDVDAVIEPKMRDGITRPLCAYHATLAVQALEIETLAHEETARQATIFHDMAASRPALGAGDTKKRIQQIFMREPFAGWWDGLEDEDRTMIHEFIDTVLAALPKEE